MTTIFLKIKLPLISFSDKVLRQLQNVNVFELMVIISNTTHASRCSHGRTRTTAWRGGEQRDGGRRRRGGERRQLLRDIEAGDSMAS